jgi:hypothetical protein
MKVDFDIYSRVKKGEDFSYSIKVKANTEIPKTEIDRIIVRGGKELFVSASDFLKASEFFGTKFLSRFSGSDLTSSSRQQLNSDSYEILLDVFKESSFTKYSIEIIKELIKSLDTSLKGEDAFKNMLITIKKSDLNYGLVHCFLSSYLLLKVIENFDWKKDQSRNKILYLALFHDLALHNTRLIKSHHRSNDANESVKLSASDKQIINDHADSSALILETIVKAPKELTTLIREHHGLKSGKGIPETLSLGINPVNIAFIVIEIFVSRYLDSWQSADNVEIDLFLKTYPEEIFKELNITFPKLTYAEIVTALQTYFKSL